MAVRGGASGDRESAARCGAGGPAAPPMDDSVRRADVSVLYHAEPRRRRKFALGIAVAAILASLVVLVVVLAAGSPAARHQATPSASAPTVLYGVTWTDIAAA